MSTTKHTPGPWLEPGTFGASRFEVQGGHPTRRIAVVDRIEDARLIAAAPDLLAVAEALVDWKDNSAEGLLQVIQSARAAILKATGSAA